MRSKVSSFIGLLFVLCVPALAYGQENCIAMTDDTARLACFDTWAAIKAVDQGSVETTDAKPSQDAPLFVDAPSPPDNWVVTKDKSAMTDEESVFVATQSNESVTCRSYGSAGPLTLMMRCMEKTTAVFLTGDCHLASGFEGYGEVTYRVDEGKAKTASFEASTDSAALGLWSGKRAIPFVKDLIEGSKLTVRFTPFGMSPVEATFDVSAAEVAVADLRGACGW